MHNIVDIIETMKRKGHSINEDANVPNIVGIRNSNFSNTFDDSLVVFWKDELGNLISKQYTITTDPGKYYLNNPANSKGTAILAEGQYKGAFKHGRHNRGIRGKISESLYTILSKVLSDNAKERLKHMARSHDALVQAAPLTVYRDNNKDSNLDFNNSSKETGMYNINIHRNHPFLALDKVDSASAGCQTFKDPKEFAEFMKLMKYKLYNDSYDYTLLRDTDINETINSRNNGNARSIPEYKSVA